MQLKSIPLAFVILVVFFGGIGVSSAMNYWQTESNKIPEKFSAGEVAGEYNPADIRGSYTFGDIHTLFNIPLEDLHTAFRLPQNVDTETFSLKSLEEIYAELPVEMGTSAVRMFVAFYTGLPYDLDNSEESYLFSEAADIIKTNGKMLPEQLEYLQGHIFESDGQLQPGGNNFTEQVVVEPPAEDTKVSTNSPSEHTITGKTTFKDLIDWGLPPEIITKILQEEMPDQKIVIKDYLSEKGIEFSSIKTLLQAEVDKQP